MQMRAVEVLDDSIEVAAPGNRVTIAVDSEFVDGEPPEDALADDDPDPMGKNDSRRDDERVA